MSRVWERVAVVGTGLIGASLAGAARRSGRFAHVVAVGRSQANLDTALRAGLVDETSTDLHGAVADSDLVVLATPVGTAVGQLAELAPIAGPTTIFTDVGSVKKTLVDAAEACGLGQRFVGAHPLAGSEASGAAAADIDLFCDKVCVLTPGPNTDPAALAGMQELWEAIGSRVITMQAEAHDEALALTSHLPHMAAFALVLAAAKTHEHLPLDDLVAGGFRDSTRVAMSNDAMWSSIAIENRQALLASLDSFSEVLNTLRVAIEAGDAPTLARLFREAAALRERLNQ